MTEFNVVKRSITTAQDIVLGGGTEVVRSNEWRVVFDGGSNYFTSEKRAREKGESLAKLGIHNELETRPKPGAGWRLVGSYQPVRGHQFKFVDPYDPKNTTNPSAFEDTSLQGRIAT